MVVQLKAVGLDLHNMGDLFCNKRYDTIRIVPLSTEYIDHTRVIQRVILRYVIIYTASYIVFGDSRVTECGAKLVSRTALNSAPLTKNGDCTLPIFLSNTCTLMSTCDKTATGKALLVTTSGEKDMKSAAILPTIFTSTVYRPEDLGLISILM